ncbi:ATP-binding protein [Candidatus Mesenet endosymbiont of Phosphuga atrata]|uniref:ATP-binding protein n=1 Tax=Candidatus Mesenet endosymbiont of Phosphuga atrata TaxID=3066221 RepID=UPI0030CCB3EC
MKKVKNSELLKRILFCLICIAIIVSITFLFAYLHSILLSKGHELAARYINEAMPVVLLVTLLFMVWFVYDQVFSKMKEIELPISIELANSGDKKITFADVVVDDSLKQRLRMVCCNQMTEEMRKMFKSKSITSLGGYILYGPPGNGKTLIARAVAGESNMNFISISGSELIGVYVGHGAHAVRELFKTAKRYSPCIVFIDEIDAIAPKRSGGFINNSAYHCRESLTQLLTAIDGFESRKGIIVIGATNLIDDIDPALIRPGRLGQKVFIPNPDTKARQKILELYMQDTETDQKLNLKDVAKRTKEYSGAELEQLVNEAKICAVEQGCSTVNMEDFNRTFQRLNQERDMVRSFSDVHVQTEEMVSYTALT